ncbi:porin family protein [Neisseriaceae bacterium B1]
MNIKIIAAISGILTSQFALAYKPLEASIGIETYQETYREYEHGTQRFMQQQGNLKGISGSIQYHFNDKHSAKLESRYAKGKITYTGALNGENSNYGSLRSTGLPRKTYDIRAIYEYRHKLNPNVTGILSVGLGNRTLKDLSTRKDPDDYDRKNNITYAHIGAGLDIALPHQFSFTPKIAYNHSLHARQYSYLEETIKMKQRNVKGLEVELPISKTFNNKGKLSIGPFYRGWKAFDSEVVHRLEEEDGSYGIAEYKEPKNYTHEVGMKIKYTF